VKYQELHENKFQPTILAQQSRVIVDQSLPEKEKYTNQEDSASY
jgi:hypothetical protein